MSRFVQTIPFKASGSVGVASIVKLDAAHNRQVLQAGVGDKLLGIVADASDALPTSATTPVAAILGEPVYIYAPGSFAPVTAGVGGWAEDDLLTSDASGNAVTAKVGDYVIAKAVDAASANDVREVLVLPPGMVMAAGGAAAFKAIAANTTLTLASSGSIVQVGAADVVVTLPPVANAGFRARVQATASTTALAAGATGIIVRPAPADVTAGVFVNGDGLAQTGGFGICHTHTTAKQGDYVELVSDGVAWWIIAVIGTFAAHA